MDLIYVGCIFLKEKRDEIFIMVEKIKEPSELNISYLSGQGVLNL